jgi:predicted ATPase
MESFIERVKNRSLTSFDNYIEQIRFPFFKQLKLGGFIDFEFPFTVLVGPNGSGKSSTLQALYGCPATFNVAHYWFSTAIDPIQESGGEPYRYIYKYKSKKYPKSVEIAQKRVRRQDDPDYWETARPMIKDGMLPMPETYNESLSELRNKTRWKKMQKSVVYIDFRAELSAFDKFFYFGTYNKSSSITSKQDFLRKRSSVLKKHITQFSINNTVKKWNSKSTTKLDILSENELYWINRILDKSYTSAQIIEHNLFNNPGYSIIFKKSVSSYSEAVAGSGEVSVVNCVIKVLRANPNSLVLLDEPEVSLHPGAQKELRELLFQAIIQKGCQVIMSTHSEHFVQGLPNNAIKLFLHEEITDTYDIINNCSAEQAFLRLGSEVHSTKRKIYVEDILAKETLIAAIKEIDQKVLNNVEVIAYPGGADTIINNLLVHFTASESPSNDIVFLDGDMRKCVRLGEVDRFTSELSEGIYELQKNKANISEAEYIDIDLIIRAQTGKTANSFALPLNGGNADNSAQALQFKLNMLDVYHQKFMFMDIETPEELVWKIAVSDDLFNIDAIKIKYTSGSFKDKFRQLSEYEYGQNTNSNQIFELQKRFLARRNLKDPLWEEFKDSVKLLLQAEVI